MNDRKKALVKLIVSLAVIVIGSSCVVVCYALHAGQEKMVFSVKSNNGLTEKVYLKTNGDVVVLSRSPKMRMITEQDNFFRLRGGFPWIPPPGGGGGVRHPNIFMSLYMKNGKSATPRT